MVAQPEDFPESRAEGENMPEMEEAGGEGRIEYGGGGGGEGGDNSEEFVKQDKESANNYEELETNINTGQIYR